MIDYFNQESERLTYRKLAEDDIESWMEFFVDNDMIHFVGLDPNKPHKELSELSVNKQIERYPSGLGMLALIEKSSDNFIGMCGIIPRDLEKGKAFEIGYSIKPKYWGKGYATESAKHFKTYGLLNNIAKQFISIIARKNVDSIKVAEKNGMSLLYEMEYIGMDVFVYGTPIN